MDSIVATELAEGFLNVSEETPTCIHALGTVPKGLQGIRPITDCSRPSGESVNDNCSSLVKKFSYLNVHDVVKLITPGAFLSVVDIQAAYRAVPAAPEIPGVTLEPEWPGPIPVRQQVMFWDVNGPMLFQLGLLLYCQHSSSRV